MVRTLEEVRVERPPVEWAVHLYGDFDEPNAAHLLPCPDEDVAMARLAVWRRWRGRDVCSVLLCRVPGADWVEVG